MELQQIDSAETDTEMEKLTRQMFSFKTIKERKQNFSTLMGAETMHLIKVMDVFEITKRYLVNGYYSAMKKRRIVETIMSFRPSQSGKKNQQETMPYPWRSDPETLMPFLLSLSGNKDPQETLPENPEQASQTNRKITLQSSDREVFEVDKAVALQSLWIKCYIDCNCADYGITISEVTSKILSKVIEYCKKHVESRKSDDCATDAIDDDLKAWDAEFMKVDQATLFDLIHAAHYLDIKSLSKLTCKTLLDMTRGQTQEEFMRTFILLIHHV